MLLGFALLAVCVMIILLIVLVMYRAYPLSEATGKRLAKYRNPTPRPGAYLELIYVCHDSKRYFTRVFVEDPDGAL